MPNFESTEKGRQAKFRKTSPTISDAGKAQTDDKGERNPHLLALGHERENLFKPLRGDDGAVKYFADRKMKWWRNARSGDAPGVGGPTRNMASSQIACVNFLLPLVGIDGALTSVLRAIDSDVQGVIPIEHKGTISPVELEWIGVDGPLEKDAPPTRGANTTSVDAFMVAETATGRRAYLMEWKYTENYRNGDNLSPGNPETRRQRYSSLYHAEASSFKNDEVSMEEFFYEPFYQLMRLRLLADMMMEKGEGELKVTDAKVVVVVPKGNNIYRGRITSPKLRKRFPCLKKVSDVFRATLKQSEKAYGIVCPSVLVKAVEQECGAAASEWVKYQRDRYGL